MLSLSSGRPQRQEKQLPLGQTGAALPKLGFHTACIPVLHFRGYEFEMTNSSWGQLNTKTNV